VRLRDPRLWLSLASLAAVALLAFIDLRRNTSPGPVHPTHAQLKELRSRRGCAECHGDEAGGMAGACLRCHEAIARQLEQGSGLHGSLVQPPVEDCGRCHLEHLGDAFPLISDDSFERAGADRLGFDHAVAEFRLVGAHVELACDRCHPDAQLGLMPEGRSRFLDQEQACESCHEDPHRGAMRRACEDCHGQERPFEQVAVFEHDERFPLVGGHAGQACKACHPQDSLQSVEALDRGVPEESWRRCLDCHASPHAPRFLRAAAREQGQSEAESCAGCHPVEGPAFAGAELPRERHGLSGFPLSPPHAEQDCRACHQPAAEGVGWGARFPGRAAQDCGACHQDPHRGQFAGGPFGGGCLDCHLETTWAPPDFDAERHERTGFALTGAHLEAECRGCHPDPPPDAPRRFRDTEGRCEDCHDDAHRGAFQAPTAALPPAEQGECGRCHGTERFAPALEGRFEHGRWTDFGLEGAHLRADCRSCHPALPEPDAAGRSFAFVADTVDGDPRACSSCHEDVHAGAFDAEGLPALLDGRAGCDRCHDSEVFRELRPGAFDHGAWTDFALAGAHAQSGCEACHGRDPAPAAGTRSLGRVADRFSGPADRCVSCHPDPHLGLFDRAGQPAEVDGRRGCARCHQPVSFRSLTLAGFDHGRWTGYALAGKHAQASCNGCHAPLAQADALGRRHGFARGQACDDCHADPHVGQFAAAGRTDCARCHDEQDFRQPRFDHQTDSRFPLDANHAALDCARCHKPWPLAGGGEAVRYKPLGTRCQDCHGFGFEDRSR